jgi:glycosyltransferase involved in cell wall biosynthesis
MVSTCFADAAAPWDARLVKALFNLLDAGIGGGQQVAIGIAGELRRRGHTVGVLVPAPGPATDRFAALGADVHIATLLSLRRPAGVLSAARIARRYDVVYSHTSVPGEILAGIAAAAARRPHVVHQHPYPHFSPRPQLRALQRFLYRRVVGRARIVAVAAHVADAVVRGGVPRDRIRVIPNGVEIPEAASPPSPTLPLRIGMLARLDASKGIDVFAEAARSAQLGAEAEFVLGVTAGEGPEAGALLRRAEEAGIATSVPQGPGAEFLRSLDIVVLPSRHEGHPLVLLEAMALGKAVVGSAIPGVREVLEPDPAGLLFPPGDADALADALRSLVADPMLRASLGARAREVASSRFALATMHERVIELLEDS